MGANIHTSATYRIQTHLFHASLPNEKRNKDLITRTVTGIIVPKNQRQGGKNRKNPTVLIKDFAF